MFRLRVLVCFLAAILYLISPFDLVPEAVFGFLGLLDDLFILLLLAIYISIIYRRVVMERAMRADTWPFTQVNSWLTKESYQAYIRDLDIHSYCTKCSQQNMFLKEFWNFKCNMNIEVGILWILNFISLFSNSEFKFVPIAQTIGYNPFFCPYIAGELV